MSSCSLPASTWSRRREAERSKDAYDAFTVAALDHVLRTKTSRIGIWIDSSDLTVAETVDEILQRSRDQAG